MTAYHRLTVVRVLAKVLVGLTLLTMLTGALVFAERSGPDEVLATYQNPFQLENEWFQYGIGDPFVLRWNGTYYLYPSTDTWGGGQVGIRAWSSRDLVNWKYEGYVTKELVTRNAYAPEVVYWNGSFYMYTSPNGEGHYVLRSDSPTGPFKVQTGNFGLSIDGSVFIDDDGQWYFLHAGHRGIRGHKMLDPYTVKEAHILESDLGGWTEGPMITKRNGTYYLTYTGNHLVSKGYRIAYSISKDGPLGPYSVPANNPVVISTKDSFNALGHSSTVLGPNLDAYYLVYHNMVKRDNPGHIRKMNIDRLVFNGDKMVVLGPTDFPQPAPEPADFATWVDEEGRGDRFEELVIGGAYFLMTKRRTESRYTAEFNFRLDQEPTDGRHAMLGCVFSYQDPDNYLSVLVNQAQRRLELKAREAGRSRSLGSAGLPAGFDVSKLHSIRVIVAHGKLRVYLDNMRRIDADYLGLAGGRIGYIYRNVKPVFRYTAFSNEAGGSSDYDAFKPIPGTIEAIHYRKEDGYSVKTPADTNQVRPADQTTIVPAGDGSFALRLTSRDDWVEYNVNVARSGFYGVDVAVRSVAPGTEVELSIDGRPLTTLAVPPSAGVGVTVAGSWIKVRAGEVSLPSGFHRLKLRLVSGGLDLKHMVFAEAVREPFGFFRSLTAESAGDWDYYGEPDWIATDGGFGISSSKQGMAITGDRRWTDYRLAVDLQFDHNVFGGEAGLLLRATNASYHPGQVQDALMGYYVVFDGERLCLRKLNYDSKTLAGALVDVEPGGIYRLTVEARGNTIAVYWQEQPEPVIEYTDPDPFTYGAVGLRTNSTGVTFRNLSLRPVPCFAYGKVSVAGYEVCVMPHQDEYSVVLPFSASETPAIEVLPPKLADGVKLVDPGAHLVVTGPAGIPGQAVLQAIGEDGSTLAVSSLTVVKTTTPGVTLMINGELPPQNAWMGELSGQIPVQIGVDGPASLVQNVRMTLGRVEAGQIAEKEEIYSQSEVPQYFSINSLDLLDGTYELAVSVTSVYGKQASTATRFRVHNWTVIEDQLLPTLEDAWFGLGKQRKTASESDGWTEVSDSPEAFFGDQDRLTRAQETDEYLVWQASAFRGFTLTVYARTERVANTVRVSVSADGEVWSSVPYSIELIDTSPAGWLQLELTGVVPAEMDADFLRVAFVAGNLPAREIQLGRVLLRSSYVGTGH